MSLSLISHGVVRSSHSDWMASLKNCEICKSCDLVLGFIVYCTTSASKYFSQFLDFIVSRSLRCIRDLTEGELLTHSDALRVLPRDVAAIASQS